MLLLPNIAPPAILLLELQAQWNDFLYQPFIERVQRNQSIGESESYSFKSHCGVNKLSDLRRNVAALILCTIFDGNNPTNYAVILLSGLERISNSIVNVHPSQP